jgi:hypothetical protein
VKYLFTIPDVRVFMSDRLCHDPLENFFGQQRQRGGISDNPNTQEFVKNTQSLRVVNELCHPAIKEIAEEGNKIHVKKLMKRIYSRCRNASININKKKHQFF